jgi:hypothetical protein
MRKSKYETLDHQLDPTDIIDQGAGGGLDADTVDGEHAAAFADAVHTHVEADITDLDHDAVKLQTRAVAATAPSSGDVLAWNGSAWAPLTGPAPGAHTHTESEITDLQREFLTLTGANPGLRIDDIDGGSDWDFTNVLGVLHIEPTGDVLMGIEIAIDGTITFGRRTADGTLIELVDSAGVLEWTISSSANLLTISKSGVGGAALRVNGSNQVQLGSLAGGSHEAGIDLAVMGGDIALDNAMSLVWDDSVGARQDILTVNASNEMVYGESGFTALILHSFFMNGAKGVEFANSGVGTAEKHQIIIGENDAVKGELVIRGHGTGQAEGAQIILHTSADHDATYNAWNIDVRNDDMRIFSAGGTTAFFEPARRSLAINKASAASAQFEVVVSNTAGGFAVCQFTQADVDVAFFKFIGTAAAATLTNSIVAEADVTTATRQGWLKMNVQDDGNQITDGAYYIPIYTLA